MHHMGDASEWRLPFLEPIHLPSFLSLHGTMLIIGSIALIVIFCFIYNRKQRVPKGITNMLEFFVIFIRDQIAIRNLGEEDGRRLTPLFCTFFFFILCLNLMGLIPIFSTATSNLNITGALALITFGFMVFGAIHKNGLQGFFKGFIPAGVPIPILFILVPIEFIGLIIKIFALMIRLFANMLAGHLVIAVMLSLVVLFGYIAVPIVAFVLFIFLLEILIAFLQAYIFTFLSAIFIGMTYHPEH